MRRRQCAGREQTAGRRETHLHCTENESHSSAETMPVHSAVTRRSLWGVRWDPKEADHTRTTPGTSNYTLVLDIPFPRGPDAEQRKAKSLLRLCSQEEVHTRRTRRRPRGNHRRRLTAPPKVCVNMRLMKTQSCEPQDAQARIPKLRDKKNQVLKSL